MILFNSLSMINSVIIFFLVFSRECSSFDKTGNKKTSYGFTGIYVHKI